MLTIISRTTYRAYDHNIFFSEIINPLEKLIFYAKKIFQLSISTALFLFITYYFWVKILFYYGAFTEEGAKFTTLVRSFLVILLPFLFWWPILYRSFQILKWLKPVFFITIGGILGNLAFNYFFVIVFKLGMLGVCMLGAFLSSTVLCFSSYFILKLCKKELAC
jgi:putative peptidoglycan lipid II flippase